MRRYLDTSLLVALHIREAGTEAAKAYLTSVRREPLLISHWTITEFSSALAIKLRSGVIVAGERTAALAMFHRFALARLEMLEVESRDFEAAAALCDDTGTPLWAGDALHLAVCRRAGARLATFDRSIAAAAKRHGLEQDLPVP
jgi:uncharacterized protein